jgi:hypothetical protein
MGIVLNKLSVSAPIVLHSSWKEAVTSTLQELRKEQSAAVSPGRKNPTGTAGLTHLRWLGAFAAVREIVRQSRQI